VDTSVTDLRNKPLSDERVVSTGKTALFDWLMIAIFVCTLYGLFFGTILNMVTTTATESAEEKRNLATMPPLDPNHLKQFFPKFEAFLNDRFAFRSELVKGASFIKYGLGVSTCNEVLIGKSDWLYYSDSSDYATLRHAWLFGDDEVKAWAKALEARRVWLEQRGIKFLLVIAPSKFSIYPEYVPEKYTQLNQSSRREQLEEALKNNTKVPVLDLHDTMVEARKKGQVYYKTDTHWNVLGGAIAASKIASAIRTSVPSVPVINVDAYRTEPHLFLNGDLADLLGLHGVVYEMETLLAIRPNWHFSDNPKPDTGGRRDDFPFALEVDDPKLPRVLFIRDSFLSMPKLFLGDCFSRAYFSPTQKFPLDAILKEKPQVVVEELVERRLVGDMPTNPPEVDAVINSRKSPSAAASEPVR
jgi:alginate O-acetyltransferase complex protein AlgJ